MSTAMIAMTTSNSTRVKARRRGDGLVDMGIASQEENPESSSNHPNQDFEIPGFQRLAIFDG
jgi:hypothetical protein